MEQSPRVGPEDRRAPNASGPTATHHSATHQP